MKSFRATIGFLLVVFLVIMGVVTTVAFRRPSNRTGIDPAKIGEYRELAKKR